MSYSENLVMATEAVYSTITSMNEQCLSASNTSVTELEVKDHILRLV